MLCCLTTASVLQRYVTVLSSSPGTADKYFADISELQAENFDLRKTPIVSRFNSIMIIISRCILLNMTCILKLLKRL